MRSMVKFNKKGKNTWHIVKYVGRKLWECCEIEWASSIQANAIGGNVFKSDLAESQEDNDSGAMRRTDMVWFFKASNTTSRFFCVILWWRQAAWSFLEPQNTYKIQ